MKSYRLSCTLMFVFAAFSLPAAACDMHANGHQQLTTATAAPKVIVAPVAVAKPVAVTPAPKAEAPQVEGLKVLQTDAFQRCHQNRQQQTVYLTQ